MAAEERDDPVRETVTRQSPWLLILAIGANVAATITASGVVEEREKRLLQTVVERRAAETANRIQLGIGRNERVLDAIAGLFATKVQVDRDDFTTFVQTGDFLGNDVQALEWVPRVRSEERGAYEAKGATWQPGFRFVERDASDHVVTAGDREAYFPVFYVEPRERNARAVGFDLGSSAPRRAALEAARDAGTTTATEPVHLVQGESAVSGVLVFRPIYDHVPNNETVESRRHSLKGFALGVFRVEDMIHASIPSTPDPDVEFVVRDLAAPEATRVLFESGAWSTSGAATLEAHVRIPLDMPGRQWEVEFAPGAATLEAYGPKRSRELLFGGLIYSTALGLVLMVFFVRFRNKAATHVEGARARVAELISEADARAVELGEANAALAERSEQLALGLKAKSQFLANMSHELRTPLNAVIGMTSLMLNGELADKQRARARILRTSGHRLLSLINDVLDFSKIEAGMLTIERISCDLGRAVEEVVGSLAPPAATGDVELILVVSPNVPRAVVTDPARVAQILTNLVGNAIKFTESGSIVVRLSLVAQRDHSATLELSVEDTGVGIPAERLAAIFEPFTQADGSTTRKYGGTGLGLSITYELTRLLGGEIAVDSTVGSGTTFTVTLEVDHSEDESSPAPSLASCHVLVVDDHEVNRALLRERLEHWGAKVSASADGEQALQTLQAEQGAFDLAIVDSGTPGVDGVALAKAVRSDPALAKVPLVLFSQQDLPEDEAQLFDEHLVKPMRVDALFEVVAHHVNQKGTAKKGPGPSRHQLKPVRGVRVLVVDDVSPNQEVARDMLETMGCMVDVAASGEEAVTMQERYTYGIIFMDCQMPIMDGFEATRIIRGREGTERRTPIVAMTAGVSPRDQQACKDAGMDGFLPKPVELAKLHAALLKHTGEVQREEGGDGGAIERKFAEMFIASTQKHLVQLNAAVKAEDTAAIARAAHKLRGGCGALSNDVIAELTREIEDRAEAGSTAGIAELTRKLGLAVIASQAELEARLWNAGR